MSAVCKYLYVLLGDDFATFSSTTSAMSIAVIGSIVSSVGGFGLLRRAWRGILAGQRNG